MQPVVYSRFSHYKIDNNDLDSLPVQDAPYLGDGCRSRIVSVGIDEPACQVCFEDFFPGAEYRWTTWIDQIDVVVQGRAEITILHPPALEEKITIVAEAPCMYLIPRGTPIVWKVLGDEVFRHFSIDMPNPGFPMPMAQSVARLRREQEGNEDKK